MLEFWLKSHIWWSVLLLESIELTKRSIFKVVTVSPDGAFGMENRKKCVNLTQFNWHVSLSGCPDGHFCNTCPPPIYSYFELHQHNISQNDTFLVSNKNLRNQFKVKGENIEKSKFFFLIPLHIDALCTKTLGRWWQA